MAMKQNNKMQERGKKTRVIEALIYTLASPANRVDAYTLQQACPLLTTFCVRLK